ncbi:NAD kinase [Stackebrandtia nassauensis]|uniref:NAD kinase n=1 Tax=Stackebrandtia nassauensis (strain DSM 44728 / CIP 108903 / NRRL B-16338 / NBRC 102104 / LLR-40K-21) TaxID=446470 RepID=D3Q534_STANL|nr:NAD kinase [Stackebrandtia nassauensis]ADD44083.1 ATP-NAD/AcoX kinase [Stackebrandtia nassauensis DSM 44728]
MNQPRNVLLVSHTGRRDIAMEAKALVTCLRAKGFEVRALATEAGELGLDGLVAMEESRAVCDVELVLALGGDGTFLRAAELARKAAVPLLGINLGQIGFLAEAEISDISEAVSRLQRGDYVVEERLTLDAVVTLDGAEVGRDWALNESTVEKGRPARMLEVLVEVDGRRLSRYGCDGVVCATPTGSTAHAMSAGGPVVWPRVDALLLVPISAHALFSRPLVVAPDSTIAITVEPYAPAAVLTSDGRRTVAIPPGATVTVRRGEHPVRVVRLTDQPFTDRLVAKLALPVDGWRGHRLG